MGRRTWPRVIFFDVGETLVRTRRPYGELLEEVGFALGISLPSDVLAGLGARIDARGIEQSQQGIPFTYPATESRRFWHETYHGFFLRFLSETDAARLARGLLELLSSPAAYVRFDDAVVTLERLRADGCRLGVISNWEAWLPALLEATGLTPMFDHIVISGLCGYEKPDIRIFTLALREGGYRPDEAVYVGDRPEHDVAPPGRIGMWSILLDRGDRFPHHCASGRIRSLTELLEAVHALSIGGARQADGRAQSAPVPAE